MILSGADIEFEDIVHPFTRKVVIRGMSAGCSHAGYDLRADLTEADDFMRRSFTRDGDGIVIEPGKGLLIPTMEVLNMPDDVVGFAKDKSTWARQGLFANQGVLEPGWRGHYAVGVHNVSGDEITVVHGDPIVQVVFFRVSNPSSAYDGKYQDQSDPHARSE